MTTNDSADASTSIDYDGLMQANLAQVFGERDQTKRIAAIRALYAGDAVLYEPDGIARGHAAISEAVSGVLARLPADHPFEPLGPAVGHHGIGRLRWRSGPSSGPAIVTGTDVAHFVEGRIHSLYVFLDPPGA